MKRTKRILIMTGLASSLFMSGCNLKGYVGDIEDKVVDIIKRDESLNALADKKLKYEFTEYKIYEKTNNLNTLNIYGKLSSNDYYSYTKLTYDDIDLTEYNYSKTNMYETILNVLDSDSPYQFQNMTVNSFINFNETIYNSLISKDMIKDEYKNYDVLNLDNISYDNTNQSFSFSVDTLATYDTYGTQVLGSIVVPVNVPNEDKLNYNISFDLDEVTYEKYKYDTKYLFDVFEEYVKNNNTGKFRIEKQSRTMSSRKIKDNEEELIFN